MGIIATRMAFGQELIDIAKERTDFLVCNADTKTCGLIEEDTAYGIRRIAELIGVIAAVIPTTNPTSTAIFKALICLKTRNGIIISPHPRAKKSTTAAAKIVLDAAVAAGAPEGILCPALCGIWTMTPPLF